jgi:hypothetical protein
MPSKKVLLPGKGEQHEQADPTLAIIRVRCPRYSPACALAMAKRGIAAGWAREPGDRAPRPADHRLFHRGCRLLYPIQPTLGTVGACSTSPRIGSLIRHYRTGLGMPRRAKYLAVGAIVVAITLSSLTLPSWFARTAAYGLAVFAVLYILLRVPTREWVLAE